MIFKNFYLNVQLLSENAKLPTRANEEDAGLDLYTPIDIDIQPWKDILIPLDIRIEFPTGFAMILKEKSGIATKLKLDIGAAVIDSPYRGNCHCHLFNNSENIVHFDKGQKIAQAIIIPIWTGKPTLVEEISLISSRGQNGFGSTGEK